MIIILKNWLQIDIVGLIGGGLQRVTSVDHVRQINMYIMMEPKYQTLWEDQRNIRIGGQCGGQEILGILLTTKYKY